MDQLKSLVTEEQLVLLVAALCWQTDKYRDGTPGYYVDLARVILRDLRRAMEEERGN